MPDIPFPTRSHEPSDAAARGGVEIAPGVRVGEATLRFSFVRSSGPGGQNVNKLATKAVLRVALRDLPMHPEAVGRLRSAAGHRLVGEPPDDELLLSADGSRSQEANRQQTLDELRKLLIEAQRRPKKRKPTKPSYGSKQRRLAGKKIASAKKRMRRGGADE
jgi:ribosome-associated protein